MLLLMKAIPVTAGAVDYTIEWIAAAPSSYDHATGGGAFDDRTLRVDVVNALVGSDFTCGDIVTYFAYVAIAEPATAETLEFTVAFQGNTRSSPGAGFVDIVNVAVNYGEISDLVAGENQVDDAIDDDGGSTATLIDERFEPAGGPQGGSLYENPATEAELIGVIRLDDLEATDTAVVVRIDAKLDCLKSSNPTGLLTAELRDASIIEPVVELLPIGIQNVILSNVQQIAFPPDAADLQVRQEAPATIAPGEPLTYTVVFANDGPDAAVSPHITNTLPASVTYRSFTAPVGWDCTAPLVGNSGVIGCHQDLWAAGEVVTLTITAQTTPTLPLRTVLTNTVVITSATLDPHLPNYGVVTTTVSAPALYGTKIVTLQRDADRSGFPSPGDTLAYTITVGNLGNAAATNVVVTDSLDPISALLSGTLHTTAGTIVQPTPVTTNTIMVDMGTVAAVVEPVLITFQVEIAASFANTATTAELNNQAVISSADEPPLVTDDPTTPDPADPTTITVTRLGAFYPCTAIPDSECAALQALYVQTNGAFWRNNEGWFVTADPCSWYGLVCATDESGRPHIVAVVLPGNHLQGLLPTNLDLLPELMRLDLSNNALAATLPASIGSLAHLEYLNLAENVLVGELPSTLGNLTALRELYLYGNNFAGDLPPTLQNLRTLEILFFQSTQICLPQDNAMLAWLATVSSVTGTSGSECRRIDTSTKPLVLVYAGLDNNLSSEWGKLINNLELGAKPDAFTIKLLIDGYGDNNSYEFLLEHDDDPTCPSIVTGFLECGRYRRGVNLFEQIEDTAQRDLLAMFIVNALYERPNASQVILVLVGHGSGWGANGLPAQPRGWTEQNGPFSDIAGGMLWDDTSGDGTVTSRSLSTRALGEALQQAKKLTGKGIDLLYLDACSMAMAEVAYEVHDSVDYLLASENTKWATFPYDQLLPHVAEGLDAQTLGERWLAAEVALLSRVPNIDYTFSLMALAGMTEVMSTTSALVETIQPLLPAQLAKVDQIIAATSLFDSNYDGLVDSSDTYVDLYDLAGQIATSFGENEAIVSAALALQQAIRATVVGEYHQHAGDSLRTTAQWEGVGGLSIYWPTSADEEKRLTLYSDLNLRWAADSTWDEWLTTYWQSTEDRRLTDLEQCEQTSDCPALTGWGFVDIPPGQLIFIPMVQR